MPQPVKKTYAEKRFEPLQKIYDDINRTWKTREYSDIDYMRKLDGLIQELKKINNMGEIMARLSLCAAALRETIRKAPQLRPQTRPPPPRTPPQPQWTPPPRTQPDFLTRMGLTIEATIDEVRKRYKELALVSHPDKIELGGSHDKFVLLQKDMEQCERYFIARRGLA